MRDWNESELKLLMMRGKEEEKEEEGEEGQEKRPRSRKGTAGALGDETSGDSTIPGNDYGPAGVSSVTG